VDISQCDKSQTARNLARYFYFLEQLGLGDMKKLWELVIGRKSAMSMEVGLYIEYFAQVVSGLFSTISMNSVIVALGVVDCLEVSPGELVVLFVAGDDVLLVLDVEISRDLSVASDRFSGDYNFEVKVFEPDILYWCGRYVIEIQGYEFFVKDPERVYSALARVQPTSYALDEAFESFVDDTAAYAWEEIVQAVPQAVKLRQERRVAPVAICRGIATVRQSKELYAARFIGVRELAM